MGFFSGFLGIIIILTISFLMTTFYEKQYQSTKHKITDAELLKLMAKANNFISNKQLISVTSLTKTEAMWRLTHLSLEGVIRQFYDNSLNYVYQLMHEIPEEDILPVSIEGLTEQQIIDTIMQYSSDYQITIAKLIVVFGLSIGESKKVLKRLKKSGKVTWLWKGMSIIYAVKDPLQQIAPKLKVKELTQPKLAPSKVSRIKIPDADVLDLAITHQRRLTPALVCLKLKIPMYEAQLKLDELYDKGAFIMDIDNLNKVVEYHLRDKNLLN